MCLKTSVGSQPPRVALVGPTASGKTAVGVHLARPLDAEILSADSMQVYRHMDIGTAKPTEAERAQTMFHGLDVVDPDGEWTLADFQHLGESSCADIAARGRTPLIVGGTGLYVRAVTTRLEIPVVPPDEERRAHWRALAQERGNAFLHGRLATVDSEAGARIHVNDVKRIIRALEVFEATGRPLSAWHAENRAQSDSGRTLLFGLDYADRRALYARIEARVDAMIADGFLDEVRGLLASGYGRDLKPMQSLGYRHMAAHLAGETDWDTAVDTLKRDTRRFARRQLIWFRADTRIHWLKADGQTPSGLAEMILARLDDELLTKGTSQTDEQTAA